MTSRLDHGHRQVPCPICGRIRFIDKLADADKTCGACRIFLQLFEHPVGAWVEDGLCGQTDPEAFFPANALSNAKEAKAVCGRCPVREECLQHALDANEQYGIWGGLDPKQRRRLKKDGEAA